jgi:hypothetical protein
VFVAVIVTPGINAPVASLTVPPSVAFVVCAKAFVRTIEDTSSAAGRNFFIVSSTDQVVFRVKSEGIVLRADRNLNLRIPRNARPSLS